MEIACALNSSSDSPEHARIAEQLGYARAWFYDSPALYTDVWVQRAAPPSGPSASPSVPA